MMRSGYFFKSLRPVVRDINPRNSIYHPIVFLYRLCVERITSIAESNYSVVTICPCRDVVCDEMECVTNLPPAFRYKRWTKAEIIDSITIRPEVIGEGCTRHLCWMFPI